MENREQIITGLGVTLLFTIVTVLLSILSDFATLLFFSSGSNNINNALIQNNILYIIAAIIVVILIINYINKYSENGYKEVLKREDVRLIAGILVAIVGLFNLTRVLPSYIQAILLQFTVSHSPFGGFGTFSMYAGIAYITFLLLIIAQIVVGIRLAKHYRRK